MAIGVTIFLAATLGAVQLGMSAVSAEGAQEAALVGARIASGAPTPGLPLERLAAGQTAAETALTSTGAHLARPATCAEAGSGVRDCGLPQACVEWVESVPRTGSVQSCAGGDGSATSLQTTFGPSPANLDGTQNPACHNSTCFGSARSMVPCQRAPTPGQIIVCLAYTSWPATAVDIWVRGTLNTVVPVATVGGLDALPVNVQLRLQVEGLAS
jgi:hypothetical protein